MKLEGAIITINLGREPQAESLKRALAFLADIMVTLTAKESGYGSIDKKKVQVFAPDCTPEQRVRTRIDEKLERISNLGIVAGDDEDTLRDLVGYLALLSGLRAPSKLEATDIVIGFKPENPFK